MPARALMGCWLIASLSKEPERFPGPWEVYRRSTRGQTLGAAASLRSSRQHQALGHQLLRSAVSFGLSGMPAADMPMM